jgi:hypothetical protein
MEDIFKDKIYIYHDNKSILDRTCKTVFDKFEFHIKKSKKFIAELYIEREWRDLYSTHYCKTSYNCGNQVLRIHFIKDEVDNIDKVTEDNYLGYITIRPIPASAISRARFNFDKEMYGISIKDKYIFNGVPTKVHLSNKLITIKNTFPFITQDSVVTVCAHADILMLAKYMYKKFNFNFLSTNKLLTYIDPYNGRKIPSQGLRLEQIVSALNIHDSNPSFFKFKYCDKQKRLLIDRTNSPDISFEDIFDVAVRSSLPIMFVFAGHIAIVMGRIIEASGAKQYIVFDDSSHFINEYFEGKGSYSCRVGSEKIVEAVGDSEDKTMHAIIPTFDRFYFRYSDLHTLMHKIKNKIFTQKFWNDICLHPVETQGKEIKEEKVYFEATLVDSVSLVVEYKYFTGYELPHYVWLVHWRHDEYKQLLGVSIVDATAHKNDYYLSIIENFVIVDSINKYKEMI